MAGAEVDHHAGVRPAVQANGAGHAAGSETRPPSARRSRAGGRGRGSAPRPAAPGCRDARGLRNRSSRGADLDDPAAAHHRDPLGDVVHHREVVRDEQVGQAERGLQVLAAGSGSAPAPRRRAPRPARRRSAGRASARAPGRCRCAGAGRRRSCAGSGAGSAGRGRRAASAPSPRPTASSASPISWMTQRLAQDVVHRHARVEASRTGPGRRTARGGGSASSSAAPAAATSSGAPRSLKHDPPGVGRDRAHDHLRQRGLAGAALADQAEALAAPRSARLTSSTARHRVRLACRTSPACACVNVLRHVLHVEQRLGPRRRSSGSLRAHQRAGLVGRSRAAASAARPASCRSAARRAAAP